MWETNTDKQMTKKQDREAQRLINERMVVEYILETKRRFGNNVFFDPNFPTGDIDIPIEFEVPKTK